MYHPEYKNIRFAGLTPRSRLHGPCEFIDFAKINRIFKQKCEMVGLILQFSVIKLGSLLTEHTISQMSLKGQGHKWSISGIGGHLVSQKPSGRLI